jgi:16S rRNA pseudouridine516 synthase
MAIAHTRLDRFISDKCSISRRDVRLLLAQKRLLVDGDIVDDIGLIINKFSHVQLDGISLQDNQAYYLMLHKPIGVVCATVDQQHKTVIDLIEHSAKHELHIVGRLDLNTSGMVLLTNDSRWSKLLMSPKHKVSKQYLVNLENPISQEQSIIYREAFSQGMYFDFEGITTLPATLEIISSDKAKVTLFEGKYHQIKRMFGRFQNPVIGLHRFAIGNLTLDNALSVGESRELTQAETINIFENHYIK